MRTQRPARLERLVKLAGLLHVLAVVASIGGCSAARPPVVRYEPINVVKLLPRDAESVEIYVTTSPSTGYTELGIVSVLTWKYNPSDTQYYTMLRNRAAEIGADAVIMLEGRHESATNYVTKQAYTGKVYRAMAIRYLPE